MNNFHVVFCDSYEALNKLYVKSLPRHTKIMTKSPSIFNPKNLYVQNLEEYTNNSYQKKIRKKLKVFLEKNFVDILKLWDSISSYRSAVIKKYFDDININSKKNRVELINKLVKSNTYGKILI